jgi:hypothetical protein
VRCCHTRVRAGSREHAPVRSGIEVKDAEGNVVGKSVKAGQTAIMQTITTRVVNSLPTMAIPPVIVGALSNVDWFKARPRVLQGISVGASLCLSFRCWRY